MFENFYFWKVLHTRNIVFKVQGKFFQQATFFTKNSFFKHETNMKERKKNKLKDRK